MNASKYILIPLALVALLWQGCKDVLEFPLENEISAEEAIQTAEDLQQLLTSCYDVVGNTFNGHSQNFHELLGPNLDNPNNDDYTEAWNHSTLFFNGTIKDFYKQPYIAIYRCNTILENFDLVTGLDAATQTQMEAEARFIRAMCHWDVVRLFAHPYGFTPGNTHNGIVISTSTSNDLLPRNTVAEVYDHITEDLNFAISNLPNENGNYATAWAAKALMAKVRMQMMDYAGAYEMANDVINNSGISLDPDSLLATRFSPQLSGEGIFNIISTSNADNRASKFSDNYRQDNNDNPAMRCAPELVTLLQAIPTDKRSGWISVKNAGTESEFYAIAKFDNDYANVPYIHLTDIMLLRAECSARAGIDLAQAIADVNAIKTRAYGGTANNLPGGSSADAIVEAAQYERRLEMCFEGDWFNHLRRRGVEGETITIRDDPWNCEGMNLQFPVSERSDVFEMNPSGC